MKKNFWILVYSFFLFIFSVPGFAETRDGHWWQGLSQDQKIFYVVGVFDGTDYFSPILTAASLVAMAKPGTKEYDPHRAEIVKSVSVSAIRRVNENLRGVTSEQVVAGIDDMYKDYKNMSIPIIGVMFVVIKSIKGASEADVREMLEARRSMVFDEEKLNK